MAHFASLWTNLSTAFKANAGVAGYGLMNEPVGMAGPVAWEQASQAAVTAIRNNGDTKLVLVPGLQLVGRPAVDQPAPPGLDHRRQRPLRGPPLLGPGQLRRLPEQLRRRGGRRPGPGLRGVAVDHDGRPDHDEHGRPDDDDHRRPDDDHYRRPPAGADLRRPASRPTSTPWPGRQGDRVVEGIHRRRRQRPQGLRGVPRPVTVGTLHQGRDRDGRGYCDASVLRRTQYAYYVVAVDGAGNRSAPSGVGRRLRQLNGGQLTF